MEDHRKLKANLIMIIQESKGKNKERVDQMTTITDRIKIDQIEAGTGKVDKTTTRREIEILQIIVKQINLRLQILNIQGIQFHMFQAINQIYYHLIQQQIFHPNR